MDILGVPEVENALLRGYNWFLRSNTVTITSHCRRMLTQHQDHRSIDTDIHYTREQASTQKRAGIAADDELLHPLCSKNDGIGS